MVRSEERAVMGRAGGNNGGIEMELNELGVGSIVKTNGNLYKKRANSWVILSENGYAYMDGVREYEVIAAVEKGPLDDSVKGDIITFEYGSKVRVAVKIREDFWQIVGAVSEFTSEELTCFAKEGSVRKVGSICGEG